MAGKRGKRFLLGGWMYAAGVLVLQAAAAQDTRDVREPHIPRVCEVVFAQQTAGNIHGDDYAPEMLDTARIQAAIDGCAPNHSVELAVTIPRKTSDPNLNAFVTGPLQLRDGVTLLVDKHVTLYASRDPQVYEYPDPDSRSGKGGKYHGPPRCGTSEPRVLPGPVVSMSGVARPAPVEGCRPLISAISVKNAGVMGEGTIDGRGYGQVIGHAYTWWELARQAEPKDDRYFSVRMIVADHADGFTLYKIRLVNSPNYHVVVAHTDGFTAWGVHLDTPVDKDEDARNTDGIDPGTSQNITIAHSWIDNGDDNIAIKQGVSHMSVIDNHFYSGHGMSIGSETVAGQSYLLVDGLTEDHTTSGIRIKSNVKRGGPVHDLTYRNVCMRDVAIPIAISPYYDNKTVEPFEDPGYRGDLIPDYKRITLQKVYSEGPGDVLIAGLNDAHRTEVTLDDVIVKGIQPGQMHLAYTDLRYPACAADHNSAPTNLPLGNLPSTVRLVPFPLAGCAVSAPGPRPDPCAGRFVPFE